jgi:predicted GIY-YIG superfamily endonuclease
MTVQISFSFIQAKETRLEAIRKGHIPEEFRGDQIVYLLHFAPFRSEKHQIGHYVGVCSDLKRRLKQHRKGNKKNSSAITAELKRRKIKFHLGHVWHGVNRDFERSLKSWGKHCLFCETCQDTPFF